MGGPDLDGLDHLDQVHPVAFGKQAPLVHEGQDRRPVGVFHDLAGLAFDGPVENREREILHVQHFGEKPHHPLAGLGIDAAADPPEIPDRGDVILAGHDPFEGVGEQRVPVVQAAASRTPF